MDQAWCRRKDTLRFVSFGNEEKKEDGGENEVRLCRFASAAAAFSMTWDISKEIRTRTLAAVY